jgi:hypothetical protein
MTSLLNVKGLPRGLRNNNPGNLRVSNIKWQGKIPVVQNTDKAFEQFTSMHFGLRAMATDIINDISRKNLNTLRKLVNVYAPPTENDTTNYINTVSRALKIGPDQPIQLTNTLLTELMLAKVFVENGRAATLRAVPNIRELIVSAIADVNPATKKRLTWVAPIAGTSLLLLAGFFFGF